jgi:NAD(P) transhydrogenase subunit alpha
MKVGIPRESFPGERRVALTPPLVTPLTGAGAEVLVQSGAGEAAGFSDASFREKGATIVATRAELFSAAQVLLHVRASGANPVAGRADFEISRPEHVVIGFLDPLGQPSFARELAFRGVTAFAIELMPRITKAQSMDALSSQATIAGYKAVLLAAALLPRMFPMLMTAAGTITPARVFVIGAGVAGLQAIATARKLGGVVQAYDVRPAVKEQVQSLGAKFVQLPLETAAAEDRSGYAVSQDEAFYRRQRETMARAVATSDVIITTAVIPGKKAPVLITREMVEAMPRGSVIVDLAAERGGNCELTRPDTEIDAAGVTILGPTNLPATVPFHASQMYAKNVTSFLLHLMKDGKLNVNMDDEITRETLVSHRGEVVNARVREALGEQRAA